MESIEYKELQSGIDPSEDFDNEKKNVERDLSIIKFTSFEKLMIIFNTIVLLSTIPVLCFIQNFTFTSTYLTPADVPFYNPSVWGNFLFERYSLEFWVLMSDLLYIIVPIFQIFILLNSNVNPYTDWAPINGFFLAGVTALKIVTAVWRTWQIWFCYGFNFCRCYSPGCCTSYTHCSSNFDFQYVLGYNVAYLLIMIIYMTITFLRLYHYNIKNQEDEYKEIYYEMESIPKSVKDKIDKPMEEKKIKKRKTTEETRVNNQFDFLKVVTGQNVDQSKKKD